MGGMIAATALAVLFVPVFFVVVMRFAQRGRVRAEQEALGGMQDAMSDVPDAPPMRHPLAEPGGS